MVSWVFTVCVVVGWITASWCSSQVSQPKYHTKYYIPSPLEFPKFHGQVKIKNYEVPHYAVFSILLSTLLSTNLSNSMEQSSSREANSHSASQKFPDFYGTRKFIMVFTRSRHWPVSWARWIQPTLSQPVSLKSSLILSSHALFSNDFNLSSSLSVRDQVWHPHKKTGNRFLYI
jgi:hypothetical protein